eukprot:350677-Prorocentrum_minimum.AAC.1
MSAWQGLDDPTGHQRKALYSLLAAARVADAACVLMVVRPLAACLATYPEDQEAVARALCSLGRRHSAMVRCY